MDADGDYSPHQESLQSPGLGKLSEMSLRSPSSQHLEEMGDKRRTRVSRACVFCSKHKKKCDGSAICSSCKTRGIPCEYVITGKRRGPAPGSRPVAQAAYVATLEDRLQKMEEMVAAASLLAGSPISRHEHDVHEYNDMDPPMIPNHPHPYLSPVPYYTIMDSPNVQAPSHAVESHLRIAYEQLLTSYQEISHQLELAHEEISYLKQNNHSLSIQLSTASKLKEESVSSNTLSPGSSEQSETCTVNNKPDAAY
jgi:hypothetical protein